MGLAQVVVGQARQQVVQGVVAQAHRRPQERQQGRRRHVDRVEELLQSKLIRSPSFSQWWATQVRSWLTKVASENSRTRSPPPARARRRRSSGPPRSSTTASRPSPGPASRAGSCSVVLAHEVGIDHQGRQLGRSPSAARPGSGTRAGSGSLSAGSTPRGASSEIAVEQPQLERRITAQWQVFRVAGGAETVLGVVQDCARPRSIIDGVISGTPISRFQPAPEARHVAGRRWLICMDEVEAGHSAPAGPTRPAATITSG